MTSTLRRWLADQPETEIADILRRRPDAMRPLPPRDLGDLADRLHYPHSLRGVLYDLSQPCVEVLSTLLVYGAGGLSRDGLAAAMRVPVDDPTLVASLRTAAEWAIAWEVDGLLHVPGSLRTLIPYPLRLGPDVVELLRPRTVDDLRSRATALGLVTPYRKAEILAELERHYADGDRIRALHAAAPADQAELLSVAAWSQPVLQHEMAYTYPNRPDPAIAYLLTNGLVIGDWQSLIVPREVGIAVRGTDWHPALSRMPVIAAPGATGIAATGGDSGVTVLAAITVPTDVADRDAAAAGNTAIDHFAALGEACGHTPAAILKSGGVGVRELRRLAKVAGIGDRAGTDGGEVRLWIEIGYTAGLLGVEDGALMPTPGFDAWQALPPATRLIRLLRAWIDLPTIPLMESQPPRPALITAFSRGYTTGVDSVVGSHLRADVLAAAAEWAPGTGFATIADLHAIVRWRRPILAGTLSDAADAITPIWAEARLLGLVGHDTLSTLGRAIARPDDTPLADVAASFVHPPTEEAIFQADLTVVVAGSPAPAIASLLDSVGDRESRGSATTWRLSATTVRRALDAGATADGLATGLRAIAVGGALPQPLEYLLTDVARRHGTLRVRAVACVLRADDTAMLAEIAAVTSLARLRLTVLAPGVLASAAPVEATLAALRAAGYAPVGEDADGAQLIERAAAKRATRGYAPDGSRAWTDGDDLDWDECSPYMDGGRAPVPAQTRGPASGSEPDSQARDVAAKLVRVEAATAGARTARTAAKKAIRDNLGVLPEPEPPLPAAGRSVEPLEPSRVLPPDLETFRAVSHYASHLSSQEKRILAEAIDGKSDVWIQYTGSDGARTRRVIVPIEIDGEKLVAWCHLRDDERNFVFSRIEAVRTI